MSKSDNSYLILGGTTRAASTALFLYLGDHPQICRSTVKETRFFLESSYPLPRVHAFEDGLAKYDEYFSTCSSHLVRMEATPDYLYSLTAAKRIYASLSDVHLVFVLRDPIERLVSWYRFARQENMLGQRITFSEYVSMQRQSEESTAPQYLRALAQGRYSRYLRAYTELFPGEALVVLTDGEIRRDVRQVVQQVCRLVKVDPQFFTDYVFTARNQSVSLRYPRMQKLYRDWWRRTLALTHQRPMLRDSLGAVHHRFWPWYLKLNRRSEEEEVYIEPHLADFLQDYYAEEPDALAQLLGYPNWNWE